MTEQFKVEDLIILHEDNHIIVVLKPQNIPSCEDESKDKDMLTARTEGGRLVRLPGDPALIGTYQTITILGATTWSLTGQLV